MKRKNIYDLILPYFTGKDDLYPQLKHVFDGGNGYVYASDGWVAIRVPKCRTKKAIENNNDYCSPNVEAVIQSAIDRVGNNLSILETADIVRQLQQCEHRIKIGSTFFAVKYIDLIVRCAQMLREEQIAYQNLDAVSPGVFSFAEVDILLSPFIVFTV
jgi:hypothetical protein